MSPGFVKLYGSILDSTIWLEALPTKIVWITMLAMADANGCVAASLPNLAKRAGVEREECKEALRILSAPDPDSKTEEHEGRRVKKADGGWLILNHRKYRDMRTDTQIATAERVRKHREKKKVVTVTNVTKRNGKKRPVRTEAEAYTEEDTDTTRSTTLSGSTKPDTRHSWVDEGREWWVANVGTITAPRFGKAMTEAVQAHGWPKVFAGLKCYVADATERGKPARPEWCAAEIVRWVEWAAMPATDEKTGLLTPRGKAILGAPA